MLKMIPYIKDVRDFIPLAAIYGYSLLDNNKLYKEIYFCVGEGLYYVISIEVDMGTGRIDFKSYDDIEIELELTKDEKMWFLKDFDYMVEWRFDTPTKQKIKDKEKIWKIKK